MDNDEKKELFTEKVVAGSRTYFFDTKEAKDGTKYLVISESRQGSSSYEHSRVMVFEEHLEAFVEGFNKTLHFLDVETKAYKVDDVRQTYPKAYERWSHDEDEQLKVKHQAGVSVSELAIYFQRQPSAIRSRLAKLGQLSAQDKSER